MRQGAQSHEPRTQILRLLFGAGALYTLVIATYFGRALWGGATIAAEDGLHEYYPQFGYAYHSWTRLLFCGYPLFADPQNMSFLPTRILLSAFGAWNTFVISGYVFAGVWACLYAYELTGDRLGALAAGLIYGATGHMLRNFTLVPMIQSMAWTPLLFFAIERCIRAPSAGAVAAGAVALACSFFGGNGQITAYSLVLAVAYAVVGLLRVREKCRFASHVAAVFVLGTMLGAIQWLPTAELLRLSQRTHMSYGEFAGWSWTFPQIAELLVPRALLGPWNDPAACSLNPEADHAYLGLIPLMLAAAGAWRTRRSASTLFWLVAGAFSLLLAFGDQTPIASLLYHIPPYNLFRVLVRHSMFLALGVAVLSARAIAAYRAQGRPSSRALWVATMGVAAAFPAAAAALSRAGCTTPSSTAVLTTGAVLAISVGVVAVWLRRVRSRVLGALLLACIALDLITFDGWGAKVPSFSHRVLAEKADITRPSGADEIEHELASHHERVWGVKGFGNNPEEVPVNRNLLWDVPSAAGYSPIAPARSLDVLDMTYLGSARGPFHAPESGALDVAAVRFVTIPEASRSGQVGSQGLRWAQQDLGVRLGRAGVRGATVQATLEFSRMRVTSVGLVMDLEDSARVAQGARVATLEIGAGRMTQVALQAGLDVAEWSIDCPSEHDRIQHRRAMVYDRRPVPLHDAVCPCQRYVAVHSLPTPVEADSLTVTWASDIDEATLRLHKVTLISQENPEGVVVDPDASALARDQRWQGRAPLAPGYLLFENRRVLPRARLVDEVLAISQAAALATIRSGRLPSGEPFDARRTALVPTNTQVDTHGGCAEVSVTWLDDGDGHTALSVVAPTPCFLVLADTYYAGWTAHIDGQPAPIALTNYAFRGVQVPAGQHRVVFQFMSKTLWLGIAVSALGLALIAILMLHPRARRWARPELAPSQRP